MPAVGNEAVSLDPIPDDLAYRLRPAEEVLWWGRPRRGRIRGLTDSGLIPGAVIAAAAIAAMIVVPRNWQPPVATLFRGAIGASALSLIVTSVTIVVMQRRMRAFAITRDRALVVGGFWAGGTHAFALEAVSALRVDARADGTGTIWFSGGTGPARPWFEDVRDARAVFEALRQAKAAREAGQA